MQKYGHCFAHVFIDREKIEPPIEKTFDGNTNYKMFIYSSPEHPDFLIAKAKESSVEMRSQGYSSGNKITGINRTEFLNTVPTRQKELNYVSMKDWKPGQKKPKWRRKAVIKRGGKTYYYSEDNVQNNARFLVQAMNVVVNYEPNSRKIPTYIHLYMPDFSDFDLLLIRYQFCIGYNGPVKVNNQLVNMFKDERTLKLKNGINLFAPSDDLEKTVRAFFSPDGIFFEKNEHLGFN